MKEGTGLATVSDAPRRVQALAFRKGLKTRALVFNLGPEPQRVLVGGLPLGAALHGLRGTKDGREALTPTTDGYRLDLGPHEVVCVDASSDYS